MQIRFHEKNGQRVAEVVADEVVINNVQDALDLMVNPTLEHVRKIIVHQENVSPDFFVLRSGLAGEILQKFVNYRVQMAIVGDFDKIESDALKAFIMESNRGKDVFFLGDIDSAIRKLTSV